MTQAAKNPQRQRIVKFFPKQFNAFNFTTQFGAAVAGVQSGKTFVGAHWSGKKISEGPERSGLIVAPTYKILQQATLPKFFQTFPELRRYHAQQKGEIALPSGGTVFIRSADNPLGIEGISPYWWWLDEGGMTNHLTWTVLRSRVSMTGGQGFITTTPYNMGWLYQQFFLPWKEKLDPQLSFFTWASIENPKFPKDFYEAEKRRLSPEEFARRYGGEFRKMSGLVWDLPESQTIAPIEGLMTRAEARIIGVDWGFRNPAAIIVIYKYDNAWYIVDEWKAAERTTGEIIQVLQNKIKEHRATKIYPDPAEPDRIEEVKRAKLPVYDTNKDVLGGISFINELIYQKRFFVYNTCPETLDEMSMYHYPESRPQDEGKEAKEEPEKFNDHLMDALRYAIYSYAPAPNITSQATSPIIPYYPELGI